MHLSLISRHFRTHNDIGDQWYWESGSEPGQEPPVWNPEVLGLSQNNLDWVGHVTLKWFFSPNYDWFCGFELSILELILTFVTEEFDKKIQSIILSFPELERNKIT